jgi:glycosyltransferase involved in cell wall biosynthesis
MRILFVHAAVNGLTAEYKVHSTLAKYAERHGVESFYVWQTSAAAKNAADDRVFYHDYGRDLSLSPKPSRVRRGLMMYGRFPGAIAHLVKTVKKIKPDVLYTSQQTYDIDLVRAASRVLRVPHVIHIHYTVGPWLGTALESIRRTPRLLAVSEFIRQTALLQGIAPEAIHTVPNALSLGAEPAPPDRGRIRSEFDWEPDCGLVVSAGRLDPGKGHLPLIEAFAAVVKRLPKVRLLICGRSTQRDDYARSLERRAHEVGLGRAVAFAGYRNDLDAIMRSADVFCLPTEMEPFGLVFLEAMAAGVATAAFVSGAVPEIVIHGVTGLLSYPGDVKALSENLATLLADRALSQKFGANGKARVLAEFTAERIGPLWLDKVQQLAAAPARVG